MHSSSPLRVGALIPSPGRRPSPKGGKKNRLLTPIRAFSFKRKKNKNRVPPGYDSDEALEVRVSLDLS
jgi:hypothetical protein